ncbi:pantetheine-phosphate adenylyltransferase family protein-like protein [Delitschia confertaspora ATCC 74209]|uniref:Pantetheine-phosphate adenylyltransferase family protein-like protein n=1 Tax=Delitschia confertaspora ATCC 74209 TaxID=1513339 RepID=A0A9P4JVG4_9PLEO|nr:pantetheine-phosphate adenylyltransferase family protein-like protein [Delitschia confertaspora ATCC 74209]
MPPVSKHLSHSLLLLPPPPSPPTFAALKAAYGPPLFSVLRQLSRSPKRTQDPVVLDVALPCSHLYGQLGSPRSSHYASTQQLVAGLYKLLAVISVQQSIDSEDSEGVDARVLLLAYPRDGKLIQTSPDSAPEAQLEGPVIDIHTLARSPRDWDTIYAVETERGEVLLNSFLSIARTKKNVFKVRGGITQVSAEELSPSSQASSSKNHYSVAVGGTFDHLHIGHKLLLTMTAFMLGGNTNPDEDQPPRSLTIGITGDELLKNKKYAEYLESWQDRRNSAHDFLSSILYFGHPDDTRIQVEEKSEPGPNGHAVHVTYPSHLVSKYVEIWDPFGPTITDESISALVISGETRSGGKAVNDKRAEKGWAPLEVFEVDVLDASEEEKLDETFQSKLSSTEIRRLRSERGSSKSKA